MNRTRVNKITDSETSITLLTVQKSDLGKYRLTVENNNFRTAVSDVEIQVQCK